MKKENKGFTLIELVVVMAIMALLALLIIGAVIVARRMVDETKHRNNGRAIQVGMEKYYASNKAYPTMANVTFDSARSTLGITLDATSECTGSQTGGGMVTSDATSFTISPANYNCTAALGDSYTQPN